MQETELRAQVERIFVNALVYTYQRDDFIFWHRRLRALWQILAQPCEKAMYLVNLRTVLQELRDARGERRQATQDEHVFLEDLVFQLARLEEQA